MEMQLPSPAPYSCLNFQPSVCGPPSKNGISNDTLAFDDLSSVCSSLFGCLSLLFNIWKKEIFNSVIVSDART